MRMIYAFFELIYPFVVSVHILVLVLRIFQIDKVKYSW